MLILGRPIADRLIDDCKQYIAALDCKDILRLTVIFVGNDPASQLYVAKKKSLCHELGIETCIVRLPIDTAQSTLNDCIIRLSDDNDVHGILLQLPLPSHLDSRRAIDLIDPHKDVDGLTTINVGKLATHAPDAIMPCTASGIMQIFDSIGSSLCGKNVCIVGRSFLVGLPLFHLLTQRNATVTLCHSHTKDLAAMTRRADIIICAVGSPALLTADMVSAGATVIDVGISRDSLGHICGDVDYEPVSAIAQHITPVPRGVGVLTVASLMTNLIKCHMLQKKLKD